MVRDSTTSMENSNQSAVPNTENPEVEVLAVKPASPVQPIKTQLDYYKVRC